MLLLLLITLSLDITLLYQFFLLCLQTDTKTILTGLLLPCFSFLFCSPTSQSSSLQLMPPAYHQQSSFPCLSGGRLWFLPFSLREAAHRERHRESALCDSSSAFVVTAPGLGDHHPAFPTFASHVFPDAAWIPVLSLSFWTRSLSSWVHHFLLLLM